MAWTAPITFTPNSAPTAAALNLMLRDNMLETMPGKATVPGRYFVTTAVGQIAEREWARAVVAPAQSTGSDSFTNLSTPGPSVTVETGMHALVMWSAEMLVTGGGENSTARMSVSVTGASAIPATETRCLCNATPGEGRFQGMHAVWYDDLTPGSNTFTCVYRTSAGATSATFSDRCIQVLPY